MFRWREQDIKQEKKIWTWVFFSGCKLCNILMQQQTKKFLTTNATTCPTSRNYCVTSELLLVLFKKVRDSFIKETKKLVFNWVGPKSTFSPLIFAFWPHFRIFLVQLKKNFGSKKFLTYRLISFDQLETKNQIPNTGQTPNVSRNSFDVVSIQKEKMPGCPLIHRIEATSKKVSCFL